MTAVAVNERMKAEGCFILFERDHVKKDITYTLVALLLVGGATYALAARRPDYPPTPSTPFSVKTGKRVTGSVVMRVNDEPITEKEFMTYLVSAPEEMRAFYASPEGREFLAQEIVKLKALEQEAVKMGLANDPDAQMRLAIDRTNILASLALQKLIGDPNEAEIRAEYEKERKNFETVELSHILVAYEGGRVPAKSGRPLSPEAAAKRADALASRLRGGADFAAMARTESDDVNTAGGGGYLGTVMPGSMPQELDAVAMQLQPGQLSTPVRSEFGIHIFKGGQRRLAPLEDQVKNALTARLQRAEATATVERLQKSAKVDLDPKFFPKRQGS